MRKTFHHGGRIGDLILSLWTMKKLGGGDLWLSLRQSPGWDLQMIEDLIPFLKYQSYVHGVDVLPYLSVDKIDEYVKQNVDYDLVDGERRYNPEDFPEWHGIDWPGNVQIAKRYANAFGTEYDGEPWLESPEGTHTDVIFHAPHRRLTRRPQEWGDIVNFINTELTIVGIGTDEEIASWKPYAKIEWVKPTGFLETASYIKSTGLVLGAASSCDACAEGLGVFSFIEQASGAERTNPTVVLNNLDTKDIVDLVVSVFDERLVV